MITLRKICVFAILILAAFATRADGPHTIRQGETLESIVTSYSFCINGIEGAHLTAGDIIAANPDASFEVGTTIQVPLTWLVFDISDKMFYKIHHYFGVSRNNDCDAAYKRKDKAENIMRKIKEGKVKQEKLAEETAKIISLLEEAVFDCSIYLEELANFYLYGYNAYGINDPFYATEAKITTDPEYFQKGIELLQINAIVHSDEEAKLRLAYALVDSEVKGHYEKGLEMLEILTYAKAKKYSYSSENKFYCDIYRTYLNRKLDEIGAELPTFKYYTQNEIQPWSEFYNSRKKAKVTNIDSEAVKAAIKANVEAWQKKGEFESTADWQKRVTPTTREQYIAAATQKYTQQYEKEIKAIKDEQTKLLADYEAYKKERLKSFYDQKTKKALAKFNKNELSLKPYDADHQTFLIHSDSYGDILLPVPASEAPAFKRNWAEGVCYVKPTFVPNGEAVSLSKLTFTSDRKDYVYDSHTEANYAVTEVNYNFEPVELASIDFSDIDISGIGGIPSASTPSSTVAVTRSEEALKRRDVDVAKNTVSPTATPRSGIDTSIPQNKTNANSTTFAVIIANERYTNVSTVPFAENDGAIFAKYLTKTVGLPENHVKLYKNATFGNMAAAIKHIENLAEAFGNKLNLIFYYAGHGVPNEETQQSMLLPVDGDASIPETCYDLNKLNATLGSLNANSVVVFMDACFSGSLRGDGMLTAARGVALKAKAAQASGNMVVVSASQGDETAYPLKEERHGMFTYFLLKKLQEQKGAVTLGELTDYIIDNVKQKSVVLNGKLQTPAVQCSPAVATTWRNWTLNQ